MAGIVRFLERINEFNMALLKNRRNKVDNNTYFTIEHMCAIIKANKCLGLSGG